MSRRPGACPGRGCVSAPKANCSFGRPVPPWSASDVRPTTTYDHRAAFPLRQSAPSNTRHSCLTEPLLPSRPRTCAPGCCTRMLAVRQGRAFGSFAGEGVRRSAGPGECLDRRPEQRASAPVALVVRAAIRVRVLRARPPGNLPGNVPAMGPSGPTSDRRDPAVSASIGSNHLKARHRRRHRQHVGAASSRVSAIQRSMTAGSKRTWRPTFT
jgi:hypothetical protein